MRGLNCYPRSKCGVACRLHTGDGSHQKMLTLTTGAMYSLDKIGPRTEPWVYSVLNGSWDKSIFGHRPSRIELNNLKLNGNKTKELIVYRPGPEANRISPPPTPGIERVSTLNVLGVILDETLTFRQHIEQRVVHSAASSMYALKVLRSRGLSGQQLWDVTTQTLVARMLYASPVW